MESLQSQRRHARWFERLLQELGGKLLIGGAAQIRAKRVRKQKTDRQDTFNDLNRLPETTNT
jgi:hypothetical protein